MTLHPAAAGFAASASMYERGRPGYPPEVDLWLRRDLRLCAGSRVLDLGAGTGKFSQRLLGTGAEVMALDPVAAMLEQLGRRYPEIAMKQGSAESLPYETASFDAVVCAQSFHWFATHRALREMRRVLKPGGRLGLIWNVRDESVPWVAALSKLTEPFAGDAPRYHTQAWRGVFPADGLSSLVECRFSHAHVGPAERVIVERILSVSFLAALPPAEQARVALRLRALIGDTPALAGNSSVAFPYTTVAFSSIKLGEPADPTCVEARLDQFQSRR